MRRREFLKSAGCFVASAGVLSVVGCDSDDSPGLEPGVYEFPQGVASADPSPSSVMLWTRAVRKQADDKPVSLLLEVSEKENFDVLVSSKMLEAKDDSDHTVRVLVEKLQANRIYYYRFRAGGDLSRVGRTRTAPKADADVEPRFAWVCCQDYAASFYGAYRRMLNDDMAAPAAEQLHFVLHVGDFIYETRQAGFMQAITDELEPVELKSKQGKTREVGEFPNGAKNGAGVNYANSVDDYRHIYKTYLLDKDLQDARARWPFICVWDDHEFSDDCWQTQANYERDATTDEPSQKRRVAASQAWFEYVPAALSDAEPVGDVEQDAKDWKPVDVENAPYSELVEVDEPNNQKAIGAITIYRNLRWGKHVELILTDSRSYRSDHALAEEVTKGNPLIFDPRVGLPKEAVNAMDAGRTANAGNPMETVLGFENKRKSSPPGSMLGAAQKAWWKKVLEASTATFKIWGNPVPLMRILLDRTDVPLIPNDLVLSSDAWDGFNSERKELMAFLLDKQIGNVVSLSGDHHAHYAGLIYDDFDAAEKKPVMVDVAVAGISSNSQFSLVAGALAAAFSPDLAAIVDPVRKLILYDASAMGGDKVVVNLNTLIRYGSKAANVAAKTNDIAMIEAARDSKINAHLRYVDTHATGYGLASVTADAVTATLVTIERSYEDRGTDSPEIRGRATLRIPHVDKPAETTLADPELSGKKPFPLA